MRQFGRDMAVFDEDLTEGSKRLNALSKWILDLLRNALIVGALQYFSKKSGSTLMGVIAVIGLCALFMYCISYTRVVFRPFHFLSNNRLASALDSIADRIMFLFLALVVTIAVQVAVNEFANVQTR